MALKKLAYALPILAISTFSSHAFADTWTVDPAQSTLGFEVNQAGNALTGTFATWTASIDFDPNAPEAAKISAEINPGSATTGNPQFDGTLPNKDWFDVAGFPAAEFKADSVSLVEGNSYRASGTVTIKGVSHPVDLDFTLQIDGDTAKAEGKATLNRLDYQLGTGVGTDTVGDTVTVTLDLTAVR
ncbi:MAG: YceI family protein [Pseudomonadota bacterium]